MMLLERPAQSWMNPTRMNKTKAEQLKTFGSELRRRRENSGMDQKVLAARLGISPQHLSQIETGYSRADRGPVRPSDAVVSAISAEFDWDMLDIRRMLGQMPQEEAGTIPMPDFMHCEDWPRLSDTNRQILIDATLKYRDNLAGILVQTQSNEADDSTNEQSPSAEQGIKRELQTAETRR